MHYYAETRNGWKKQQSASGLANVGCRTSDGGEALGKLEQAWYADVLHVARGEPGEAVGGTWSPVRFVTAR